MPESFADFISKLDTTILKSSWQSIDIEEREGFEDCFSRLIGIVKEVDVNVL